MNVVARISLLIFLGSALRAPIAARPGGGVPFPDVFLDKPFPAFRFTDANGRVYTRDSLMGKTTIVEVWEKGCGPCMSAIKYLNGIHDSLSRRGVQLFSFLKNSWPEYEAFKAGLKPGRDYMPPGYELISIGSSDSTGENRTTGKMLNSYGWPLFLIVDKEGVVRYAVRVFNSGNDVHDERTAEHPFENRTVQKLMAVVDSLQTNQPRR